MVTYDVCDHWQRDRLTLDKAAMYLIAEDAKRIHIRRAFASLSEGDILIVYRSTAPPAESRAALRRLWEKCTGEG